MTRGPTIAKLVFSKADPDQERLAYYTRLKALAEPRQPITQTYGKVGTYDDLTVRDITVPRVSMRPRYDNDLPPDAGWMA